MRFEQPARAHPAADCRANSARHPFTDQATGNEIDERKKKEKQSGLDLPASDRRPDQT